MARFLKLLLLAAVALLAACAGPQYGDVVRNAPPLKPGEGRVYVYMAEGGTNIQPKIRLNGEVIGRAKVGMFFYVDRPAGNYVVTDLLWTGAGLSFTLPAGETRYVTMTAPSLGSTSYVKGNLVLVDPPAEAQRQMLPLHYGGAAR
ncbi:DUF2846 domain-containing protein [Bordetella sp. LUAb4]|uniref:DUF2846 domain-containing protein n=1 Tax=Bordetella sp. LUAb4 TaxID=2843195 RepID=UPI001E33F670|nr:DUF2846 domain-containing protein [Bordetella sp. LUAb4]